MTIANSKQVILFVFIMCFSAGCAVPSKNDVEVPTLKVWEHRYNTGSQHKVVGLKHGDQGLIEQFIEMYRSNSYIPKAFKKYGQNRQLPVFDELVFDRVVEVTKNGNIERLFIFHIKRVNDLQATFKVDTDNRFIDNFIISSF